ncbi:alpha/beta hydrolase [Streptomyces sp. NBC_01538]|uniref:alpha/beta hydrolase n=1 Tax=Streptomyces sp. NBC_01538 TaxID=2903897 RepID=UPI003864DC76
MATIGMEINKIYARSPDPYLQIRRKPKLEPGSLHSLDRHRIIILVHGFQNSEERATRSYEEFMDRLSDAIRPSRIDALGSFWQYHWPGDHPKRFISTVTYAARISDAREAGRLLAMFLSGMKRTQEVILIGHSLGCRVILEAARFTRDDSSYRGAKIRKTFLLAAAVPIEMCTAGRIFDWRLEDSEEYVFWSRKDRALGRVFQTGQYLYGEPGTAVGRHGMPIDRWTPRTMRTGLGHSDYWSSFNVAQRIATLLGRYGRRILPEFPGDSGGSHLEERELDQRRLTERRLPIHD